MSAILRLFRTTAFKIAFVYSLLFAFATGAVVLVIVHNLGVLLERQIIETVDADIRGLADQFDQGGVNQLARIIARRIARPGAEIYLLTSFTGAPIVGNVAALPLGALDASEPVETSYRRAGDEREVHRAVARIVSFPGGFKLLVGHDIEERNLLRRLVRRALLSTFFWLAGLGALGGLFVARRVLKRVDAMSASATAIMGGDLSGRLPTDGSGDELDRLAQNLNAMIERIEALLKGVREVTDNVAHDLRTPLTRLRNDAEEALRQPDGPVQRKALEKIIGESDQLIRIFEALLLIARAESGAGPAMQSVDVTALANDAAELYEAATEDHGGAFASDIAADLFVKGNRELLFQALANLIDNALKYAGAKPHIALSARREGARILLAVADNGPGIAPHDRERARDRFVRLDDSRSTRGSGLGLSLVSAIAHLHDGTFRLEDNAPGLRAVIDLPAGEGTSHVGSGEAAHARLR
ncbi:MAG: HAMP domain-containing histidine kinase [Hyphomicrobiales bacterium]|nr:HAMP domain-containing histidine kinase [Hyphomicrobiales bacterium]